MTSEDIITFWFEELNPKDWWVGGSSVDQAIANRFGKTVEAALHGELFDWRRSPGGRLAEIICLDQFTRNMFRGTAKAFAGDPLAMVLSQEAIAGGYDDQLTNADHRTFLYMPLMHAESLVVHALAKRVFTALGSQSTLGSLADHTAVIAEYGRYPSRNAALGRASTPAEIEYLKNGKTWGQS